MSLKLSLNNLSTELLIKIFSYLEIKDLCNLSISCKRFKEVISSWDRVIIKLAPIPLATNQLNEVFLSKCFKQLKNMDKLRIGKNWRIAKYTEQTLLYTRKKYIPYLQMSDKFLWLSRGAEIKCYERTETGVITEKSLYTLRGRSNADVVNFQLKNNVLVSGFRDGTLRIHNIRNSSFNHEILLWHNSDVNSVDIGKQGCTIVSGARDGTIKIVSLIDGCVVYDSLKKIHIPDIIWKVSLSEDNKLAVGTSGNVHNSDSLFIYDVTRGTERIELPHTNRVIGGGVLDIRWDGPQMLWSCGYDSVLRRWDLRTGKSEQNFMDPCGSVLYCLDYDHFNTVMTGANMNGRIMLWDVRQASAAQLYFLESCKKGYNRSSPVYSLAFDSEFLVAVTDQNLNVLNFSTYDQPISRDYTFFLFGLSF